MAVCEVQLYQVASLPVTGMITSLACERLQLLV